jgi:hypothetical protein
MPLSGVIGVALDNPVTRRQEGDQGVIALFAYHIPNFNPFETRTPARVWPERISHL